MYYEQLQKAMLIIAHKAREKRIYGRDQELAKANEAAIVLFSSPKAIMHGPREKLFNVTFRALRRTDLYILSRRVRWRTMDWDALLTWLYDNWDKVLRVILSLLLLIL